MNTHNPSTAGPSRSQASPSAALQRTPGRRPLLDDDKRTQILAILTNGSSRRIAAHYVGCSPGTITHTAQRDPQFADQLARAEQTAEIELVRSIRNAARQEKYWRAAAWLLERRNPADFALRPPQTFTAEQFEAQVAAMAKLILDLLPPDWQAKILQELDPAIPHFWHGSKNGDWLRAKWPSVAKEHGRARCLSPFFEPCSISQHPLFQTV